MLKQPNHPGTQFLSLYPQNGLQIITFFFLLICTNWIFILFGVHKISFFWLLVPFPRLFSWHMAWDASCNLANSKTVFPTPQSKPKTISILIARIYYKSLLSHFRVIANLSWLFFSYLAFSLSEIITSEQLFLVTVCIPQLNTYYTVL